MGARGKIGLELVPELGRLVTDIPDIILVAGLEIPLLGTTPLLVGPDAYNNAGIGLPSLIEYIVLQLVIHAVAGPLAGEGVL